MEDKALRFLGLARRARLLEVGEEPVGIACRAGHARLLLIAQDAADHTFRRARSFCRSGKPPYICAPFSKEALGSALGCNSCALCAFTDAPMALAFLQALDAPEKYEAILTELQRQTDRVHYEKLMSRLQVSEDDFREAIAEIRHLSPKPGNLYAEGGTDTTPYIIPDFILDYQDGHFQLSLNSYNVPEVRVNRRYMDMIREMVGADGLVREKDKEAIQFVKNKIDSAKWFISAIKQRHDTLMRTMQTILDYQQEYFKDGDKSKLRPMILKDIADRTGLDVSTISRVVNSKYVQTQFGIILLKSLFSEAMQTDSGEEVSSYEIKNILQECIDDEDKRHPLTDETLMDILNGKGYRIARRTVAKYREMLGIPVARLRKQT